MDQFQSGRLVLTEHEMTIFSGGSYAGGIFNEFAYRLAYGLGFAASFGTEMYHRYYPLVLK